MHERLMELAERKEKELSLFDLIQKEAS